ncbi:ABC transporter ATP-binding protein [Rhodoplanes sp. TEM]|uniref:ABC transporter ATP-binding protein n=1 Tax=Rhodoplanes tepidamans TaxID=200616 RepID=A0ABT5JDA4_RHOTP|nr:MULTISPECIES: ABC transporter ATP-binding protein [Rhodoplanes]MDC7787601.1 ABC transporter ATP-binding protein [Rhodoplanes tepidamans]MDC7986874.1 ABC transporter ATP-binding protein [Rhodoplanes sp. TEM]MDQ0358029.1 peptide/nickel transport system ATP-binding protein [Rhodoplanes tepidamans]
MSTPPPAAPLVRARNLTVDFVGGARPVRAVAGVDLSLAAGEVVALLGESGSGKSVTLRALMRLLPEKRARIGGSITVDGRDVAALGRRELARFRGGTVAMIFQEPGLAFDPVYRVGDQIAEAVVRHERVSRKAGRARALELFERVRIPSAETRLDNYPHEMSGGMRQRAMIALALACRPKVLLADEPTTALDATVQIQILLLLRELQREFGLAVIFVTHDIGVATEVADRIAVMYAGRIVERGDCRDVIRAAAHPYTRGLLASRADHVFTRGTRLATIPGAPPDLGALPPGCAFAPRCAQAVPACEAGVPEERPASATHVARCILLRPPAQADAGATAAA